MAACVQLLFLYVLESGPYIVLIPVFRVQHLFVRACAGGIGCAGRREPGQAQGGHGRLRWRQIWEFCFSSNIIIFLRRVRTVCWLRGASPPYRCWACSCLSASASTRFRRSVYTVDVYRGSVSAEQRFWRYLLFISFFPQLVAGPIERSGNILPQLQLPARFSYERAKSGLVLMLWGYIQKMVVADRLALPGGHRLCPRRRFGRPGPRRRPTVLFCFELYCDFSSYTDIARGAARILGVELMENFRSPFLSQSVAEFWRNWHISLSSFFRDYLYIPLGGSRRGLARTCVNTMVVFLCSGLWHGAAWTFVAWGLLHGLYLVCGRLTLPLRKRLYTALRVPYGCLPARLWRTAWTFALVAFSMIFFRAGGMDAALSMVRSLLRPGAFPGREAVLAWGMDGPDLLLSAVCVAAVVLCDVLRRRWGSLSARLLQKPLAVQWAVLLAGVLTVAIFGMYGEGYVEKPFIYFQF